MVPLGANDRRAVVGMAPISFWLAHCRLGEGVVISFFSYTAALSLYFSLSPPRKLLAALLPITFFLMACAATCYNRRSASIARDWAVLAAVLCGYWQMAWFGGRYADAWQSTFLSWDRFLLNTLGLRHSIEWCGAAVPWLLEFSYTSLYAIPPICIVILYWKGARLEVGRFLQTFALGTLTAYALLPLFRVDSPRLAFPGQDMPGVDVFWRTINVWVLTNLDIGTSVFPSGHVAVAFSSAFGFRRALPGSRSIFYGLLMAASLVFLSTIYGRYHYAADGLASIAISVAAWLACEIRSVDVIAVLSARVVPSAVDAVQE